MPGLTTDNGSPVRVVVTPSQSSYFAGEPFSVTITFTNTRSPEAGPSKPSLTHKRGAHSISSAPLARPPTSPGTPRSAIAQPLSKTQALTDVPRRKGLVGKKKPPPSLPLQSASELPELIEQRRKRQSAPKALSVSLSPNELENEIGEGVIASSARYTQRSSFRDSESSAF
jgi:RAB6A-GEF complex partner protein 2